MAAVGVGFFALYLAVTLWVYFDATETGRPAVPWALATFFLVWFFALPLILYAMNRDKDRHRPAPGAGKRLYLYITAMTGLVVTSIGGSLLVGSIIANAVATTPIYDDGYKDAVATGIVSILVGGAVWLIQWLQAEKRLAEVGDDEFRPTFAMHRVYLNTVLGLFWIGTALGALTFFGGLVADALGSETVDSDEWLPALGPLVVALGVIGYHRVSGTGSREYAGAVARHQAAVAAAAAPAPEPEVDETQTPKTRGRKAAATAAGARFCSNCGTGVRANDTFCASCGQQLR